MALYIKSSVEVEGIRQAGKIVAELLRLLKNQVGPGMSLKELEDFCADFIRQTGGVPTFLGYRGFPAAVCRCGTDLPGWERKCGGYAAGGKN